MLEIYLQSKYISSPNTEPKSISIFYSPNAQHIIQSGYKYTANLQVQMHMLFPPPKSPFKFLNYKSQNNTKVPITVDPLLAQAHCQPNSSHNKSVFPP
jgi:hypothetical protein